MSTRARSLYQAVFVITKIMETSPFVHALLNRCYLFVILLLAASHARHFRSLLRCSAEKEEEEEEEEGGWCLHGYHERPLPRSPC